MGAGNKNDRHAMSEAMWEATIGWLDRHLKRR